MLFNYQVIDQNGNQTSGSIDALNVDSAISSLQRRGFVISSIKPAGGGFLLGKDISFFERIKSRDVVLLSRQLSTLFEAQVSALRIFRLLGAETENAALRRHLGEVAEDLQSGSSISAALSRHPKIFSEFYVNMVRAGEESGKLDQTFSFLADNLEQSYLLTSKAKNALIYPAFVIITFIGVMVLMLTTVIPKLSAVLIESGKEVPIYTKVVLGISDFFVNYGIFMLFAVIIGGFSLWRWSKTSGGQSSLAEIKLTVPYLGSLYRKLYLARIASNLNTMLLSAIPIIKSLELTASIVGNRLFEKAILESADAVKAGSPISGAFAKHREFPGIMVAMIRVGEETGEMGEILKTLSRFYQREVFEAVDTLVGLIEPVMIVGLGLAVGFLIASVLVPIYNISSGA